MQVEIFFLASYLNKLNKYVDEILNIFTFLVNAI